MGGDGVQGVPRVLGELDSEAGAARDFVAAHAAEQLGALAREHGTDDQLDVALELGKRVMSLLGVGRGAGLVGAV